MTGEPNTGDDHTTEPGETGESTGRGWADLAVAVVAAVTYLVVSQSLGTLESVGAAAVAGLCVAVALNYTSFR
ncbi:hypothetical protein [Haloarchaeobius sp. DT45]|uniref:hypothetical protein n=1 Tax=Haloarchaeobius sp. DT45 TaxID=3446116 RepID=UPI003F6B3363